MNNIDKYVQYETKHTELMKMINNMTGGSKFKIIVDEPKLKYVKYNGKNNIHIINTIDNDNLHEFSEFMIGSIAKIFTAMLIVILNDKNILNVNDSVGEYIESNKDNDFQNITINDLINHTGGIMWYLTYKDIPSQYKIVHTSTVALEIFMTKPLCVSKKGIKKYSSMGYVILGAIIEKVTNMSYIDALKFYILDPCKMYDTNIGEPNITIYNNNVALEDSEIKEQLMEKYMVNAGGGLYSCVADMLNFVKYIPKILTPAQIKRCYGFRENNTITHGGSIYGGSANFKVEYTTKWKIKMISIEFSTWTELDY